VEQRVCIGLGLHSRMHEAPTRPLSPQLLAFVRRWRRFNTDLPGLLDEWAASLFRELDYRHEAANGVRFRELYGHMEVGREGRAWMRECLGWWVLMMGVVCDKHALREAGGCSSGLQPSSSWHCCRQGLASTVASQPPTRFLLPAQDVYVPRMHTELCTRKVRLGL